MSTVICLLSTGCGFHAVYAQQDDAAANSKIFGGVKVDSIAGHEGQLMRIALEDQLNPEGDIPPNPAYRLNVTYTSSIVPIGAARDGTVSTYNVYLMSHYILYRTADDKGITSGDISYVSSYDNVINEYYSTYVSEEDAIKRNITEIAELYRGRIASYLDAGAPEEEIKKADPYKAGPAAYTPALFNELPGVPINAGAHP